MVLFSAASRSCLHSVYTPNFFGVALCACDSRLGLMSFVWVLVIPKGDKKVQFFQNCKGQQAVVSPESSRSLYLNDFILGVSPPSHHSKFWKEIVCSVGETGQNACISASPHPPATVNFGLGLNDRLPCFDCMQGPPPQNLLLGERGRGGEIQRTSLKPKGAADMFFLRIMCLHSPLQGKGGDEI